MSRFFSRKLAALAPYTPGEQPRDQQYLKLNTNESPFPPSEQALAYAAANTRPLNLYSDPECRELKRLLAGTYGVGPENVCVGNGSDEILNFAFLAFCDADRPAVFPDITYGFYPVFAQVNCLSCREIPLRADLTIAPEDYFSCGGTVFLANPNAPTGLSLPVAAVRRIAETNPGNVLVVDEAYVDFGGESCVPLTKEFENILVVQTFSKSRSMAGGRLGYAIGSAALIRDLETIRYSTNPYNVNSYTAALGAGTLLDAEYTRRNCEAIVESRAWALKEMRRLGFDCTDSRANFLFVRHSAISGEKLYRRLRDKGVLVRHFSKERIADYNRVTVGTRAQMEALVAAVEEIFREEGIQP